MKLAIQALGSLRATMRDSAGMETGDTSSGMAVSARSMAELQCKYLKVAQALRHSVEKQSALLVECRSLKEQLVEVTSQLQAASFLNEGTFVRQPFRLSDRSSFRYRA